MRVSGMKVYGRYFRIQLKSQMQYKVSFFLTILGQFVMSFNMFLGIFFMFKRFHSIEGFTYEQVLLCYGIFFMGFRFAEQMARGFDTFSTTVRNGEFDRIMVRPRNEILQVLGSKIEFSKIGGVVQAVVILVYAITKSQIRWNLSKIFVFIGMITGSTIVFIGIFLIYASLCFFTLEGLEFINIFTDGAREFGEYPLSIYGKRIMQFCTFIIPYALIQYYPLLYLLDQGKRWYGLLPLVAHLFIIPCYAMWRIGVKHYQSNGS